MAEEILLRNIGDQATESTEAPEKKSALCRVATALFSDKFIFVRAARRSWRHDPLSICLMVSLTCGLLVGLACNRKVQNMDEASQATVLLLLNFPGEMLMRMLMMLILPLIICSIIVGFADVDRSVSGKLSRNTVLYYMSTMCVASSLGIALVAGIGPGRRSAEHFDKTEERPRPLDSLLDLLRNLVPPNLIQAALMKTSSNAIKLQTNIVNHTMTFARDSNNSLHELRDFKLFWTGPINSTHNQTHYQTWQTVTVPGEANFEHGTNLLGLVLFAICFGIVLGKMRDEAGMLIDVLRIVNKVILRLLQIVMWYAPFGIFSLLAGQVASMEDIAGSFHRLALYMATVLVALHIHIFLILTTFFLVVVRRNPLSYMKNTLPALIATWCTSSSTASLPISYRCLTDKNRVDKRVARLVLPIGAIINVDGAALYEAIACLFVAQLTGANLSFADYIRISITATLVSVGSSGLPGGLVTLFVALHAAGLPAKEAFPLLVSVDWFLDRFRTAYNVMGDSFGAAIIAKLSNISSNMPKERELESL